MLPVELILARNGRIVRYIQHQSFIWRWMYLHDGRQVAYETGPLHFSMMCVLVDIGSGKRLADFDCFPQLPDNAPEWVRLLEAKGQESFAETMPKP